MMKNVCEYCHKPIKGVLPVHKVCALEWLIKEHEKNPPTGDMAILVSKKDYDEAMARVERTRTI